MSPSFSTFLQLWGGSFYLLNKICFSGKERTLGEVSRQWNIAGWLVYTLGLPAWLIILAHENNWMVTLVEAGGLPSMLLGLTLAIQRKRNDRLTVFLDRFAWLAAIAGIGVSLWHLGVMTRATQWVELGVTLGFLIGTYKLAHERLNGYLWFLLMNASAGVLMFMQGYFWLGIQQVLSLVLVMDAYVCKKASARVRR